MRHFLLLVVGLSFCSLLFGEEDLFATLDTTLPVAELNPTLTVENDNHTSSLISSDPDLRIIDFYRRRRPINELKVPEISDGERLIWKLGNVMRDTDIPIGEYTLIRVRDRDDGFHIRYLGKIHSDGHHSTITDSANEILPGDYIVKENFAPITLPPTSGDGGVVARNQKSLGSVFAFLEPEQEQNFLFAGNRQLIGAKFKEYKGGNSVSIGATFVIRRKGEEIAKAVVVDADLDLATLYVFQSEREVKAEDEVFSM